MSLSPFIALLLLFINGDFLLPPVLGFGGVSTQLVQAKLRYRVQRCMSNEKNDDDRGRGDFARAIIGFQSSALKETIETGDTVVCKQPIPSLGIYENASYELKSIYAQYFDEATQSIVKKPLASLDEAMPVGSERYIILFSPSYHTEPVIVSPDEVGLSSVRSELGSAAWLAVPGFFWVFVASSFYNIYHERTGGNFLDAFLGR